MKNFLRTFAPLVALVLLTNCSNSGPTTPTSPHVDLVDIVDVALTATPAVEGATIVIEQIGPEPESTVRTSQMFSVVMAVSVPAPQNTAVVITVNVDLDDQPAFGTVLNVEKLDRDGRWSVRIGDDGGMIGLPAPPVRELKVKLFSRRSEGWPGIDSTATFPVNYSAGT